MGVSGSDRTVILFENETNFWGVENEALWSLRKLSSENKGYLPQCEDPWASIPIAVVTQEIFSHLNLHELGVCRAVSKKWKQVLSDPLLCKTVVYRELAFSSKDWIKLNLDLVKNVDLKKEMGSLPNNIEEELRCSAFPNKNIRETHLLVRIPKGLSINKLQRVIKDYFPYRTEAFRTGTPQMLRLIGGKQVDDSVWLLMTKEILPGSKGKSYGEIKNIMTELNKTTKLSYQVPTILEVATCILAEHYRSKNRLFDWTTGNSVFTYCQETFSDSQAIVGGVNFETIMIDNDKIFDRNNGIVLLKRF